MLEHADLLKWQMIGMSFETFLRHSVVIFNGEITHKVILK